MKEREDRERKDEGKAIGKLKGQVIRLKGYSKSPLSITSLYRAVVTGADLKIS
jgi:hypothetical protein